MTQLSNDLVAWPDIDNVLLDMDGTLLDLNFDTVFWLQVVPQAYARAAQQPLSDIMPTLRLAFESQRGSLNWYDIDYWTRTLRLDVMALQQDFKRHIGWLDGAQGFLDAVNAADKHVMLVTNADRKTLGVKDAQTGLIERLDDAVSSHDFGCPKEHPAFWDRFFEAHPMDRARTLFVDDTLTVLASARNAGIGHVVAIAQPDSTAPARAMEDFVTVNGVGDLVAADGDGS